MKKLILLLCVLLGTSVIVLAGPCSTTTLNQYLGSGFPCGIDDKTFSNFVYSVTAQIRPVLRYRLAAYSVNPITTSNNPGFTFSAGWFASTSSGIIEEDCPSNTAVNVNPGGSLITDVSLSIGGVGFMGTGAVIVDETVCLGAMLPACSAEQSRRSAFSTAVLGASCLTA